MTELERLMVQAQKWPNTYTVQELCAEVRRVVELQRGCLRDVGRMFGARQAPGTEGAALISRCEEAARG